MFTFPQVSRVAALFPFLFGTAHAQQVVINEIHYDEDDPTVHSEYIELHNPGTQPQDLSGCYFSEGISLTFPAGTVVAPGGFVVVCEDPAVLQSKWGVSGAGVFSWNAAVVPPVYGQLKNSGETLTLRSTAGTTLDEVDYGQGFPWPTVGDPPNYSIELIHPSLDNNLGGSWRRSDAVGGGGSPAVTYVPLGSASWHYRKAQSEASTPMDAWRALSFAEDATWLTSAGGAPFGYGEAVDTLLADMPPNAAAVPPVAGYSGIYLRHAFQVTGTVPGQLQLRVFNDDGFVAWINGTEVARFGPAAGQAVAYSDFAGRNHEHQTADVIPIPLPNSILNVGTPAAPGQNVLSIHALNANFTSSDFYIDAELSFPGTTGTAAPSPRAPNTVLSGVAPPAIRQVDHTPVVALPLPEWPPSGQPVRITARITDPQGMGAVSVAWQVVEPGDYIKITDTRYNAPASWTTVAMTDDGQGGDQVAGDALYSALIPAGAQQHRRLIRYRISAADAAGAGVQVPYADDPQPNFAYYVYDALPGYTAKATPAAAEVTYPPALLATVPAYHLITRTEEHSNAQNVPVIQPGGATLNPTAGAYGHSLYNWQGALCYDGKVYDHIRYRARGGVWRFAMGKNMWKFDFNKGHDFQARDNYGRKYDQPWKKLNFSSCIQQGDFANRGEQGLFESVGFRLFQLTGMPAEHTQFVHFRVVERPSETNGTTNQFDDDFQGLYLGIEQQDGQFLDEHGLPDGNLYKMESGTGELNHTGTLGPKDKSDLTAFLNYGTTEAWWRANCDLPNYYNYRAIIDSIHHYDIGDGKNYFYYRNPLTTRWTALAWDLDLTWADNMYRADSGIAGLSPSGNSTEPFFSRVFGPAQTGAGPIPVLRQEMRNRVREVQDLLFTAEQTGMLIDEMASFIFQPGQPSFVDADRAMWDYNPILVSGYVNSSKAGHGRFYQSAVNNPATPESELAKFTGMMVKMKNYITTRRNVITSQVLTSAEEALVPTTPVLARSGSGPIPTNALSFTSSAFAGKNGAAFAGLKWRIAEATDPAAPGYLPYDHTARRAYEIENAWESAVLTPFPGTLTAPPIAARPGGNYRARVKHLDSTGRWSHWSAPVSFIAAEPDVTVYLQSLVITAVHYHPAPPNAAEAAVSPDPEAYEWIELMNVGPAALDLSPVRFTKGIDFAFAGSAVTSLEPGQRVLVVRNLAAFTARYGVSPGGTQVAGEWQLDDALSNSGEQLKLSYGQGSAIRDFTYDDNGPWPDGADGGGHALVLTNPSTLPDPGNPMQWRLSTQTGGTPGQSDRISYASWAAAIGGPAASLDSDGDGVINLTEYALGSSATTGSSLPAMAADVEWVEGIAYSRITFVRRAGADDAVVLPQWSTQLQNWDNPPISFQRITVTSQPDGTVQETFRSTLPLAQQTNAFFRLKIMSVR